MMIMMAYRSTGYMTYDVVAVLYDIVVGIIRYHYDIVGQTVTYDHDSDIVTVGPSHGCRPPRQACNFGSGHTPQSRESDILVGSDAH